jgi:predicted ribosome quality control (RQC) complex YloA/Tae2 family protein
LRLQTRAGTGLLLGRTARQNEAATFKLSAPDDLWFHARNVPGAHVILRTGGAEPSEDDLVEAAALAAGYSRARAADRVDVVFTERRNVRAIPGAPPGLVNYRNARTIRVAPNRRDERTSGR